MSYKTFFGNMVKAQFLKYFFILKTKYNAILLVFKTEA